MHVRVDQARHERQAGHVANLIAVRSLVDGDDSPVLYDDGTDAEIVFRDTIPDAGIPIGNPAGHFHQRFRWAFDQRTVSR